MDLDNILLRLQSLANNVILNHTIKVILILFAIWILFRLSDLLAKSLGKRLTTTDEVIQKQFLPLLNKTAKTFIVIIGILLIAQNLGYSITSVLTGLGIGGLAVALAAQETLSNFFASIMLLTDMPFRVGDLVAFSGTEGTVESIGFRSTRLRTGQRSIIIVPNKTFMNTTIENFSLRDRRRVSLNIALALGASSEQVQGFLQELRNFIVQDDRFYSDSAVVHADDFKVSYLNVLVQCFTKSYQNDEYQRVREILNLEILRIASKFQLEFAKIR